MVNCCRTETPASGAVTTFPPVPEQKPAQAPRRTWAPLRFRAPVRVLPEARSRRRGIGAGPARRNPLGEQKVERAQRRRGRGTVHWDRGESSAGREALA